MQLSVLVILGAVAFIISIESQFSNFTTIVAAAICLFCIIWIGVALLQKDVELKRIDYVLQESVDGYQYVTVNENPVNITKRFGRFLKDNEKIQSVIYEDMVLGINFPDSIEQANLEIVKTDEVQETK